MKKALMLIMLSPLLTAETLVSLTSLQQSAMLTLEKVEGSCCEPKATFLHFESSDSVDGISFKGVLNPRNVGDKWNYITGKGLITFIRDSDQKSFTIQAGNIGFQPGDDFTNLFIEGPPGFYKIPGPIKIEANKMPMHDSPEGLSLIEIKNDIIKITCLWCFARGYSQQEVYKIKNTDNEFSYYFLYTLPENAEWNEDGTFSYHHMLGGALTSGQKTLGPIKKKWAGANEEWVVLKKTEWDCWDGFDREWEYNEDAEILELVKNNDATCPQ